MVEFKAFEEMAPEDYDAVGFKSGLEVHQQLFTRRKLFCRCPARCYSRDYDAQILRHMRPTLSELGEYDGTALMEFKTKKEILYRVHRDTICTYEMDDTPPFMIDEPSLDIAIEIALLLRLNLVSELHISRKQYLDGSLPTGFQRTTILGVDGWIPYKNKRIGIAQLGLEEDSCREVSDIGHERVFLTDRLGVPLVEPVTNPDMKTPQEAAEVCEIIRRLLRATGKVRTGHGATREDVNVSVRGGSRSEIKGVSSIRHIPLLLYNEAMRQWSLLRIRESLEKRGVTPQTFSTRDYDVTRLVAATQYYPVRQALDNGQTVRCVVLERFAGILSEKTQTDTTFAKEVSDRVRVVACLTTLPNIAHSDAASETLSAEQWKTIRHRTKAGPDDALVLVWGNEEDAQTACNEVTIRAKEATEGVPRETRQALRDGTTGFERILPGPERMYPDTDLPPVAVSPDRVEKARARLPEPPWEREVRYGSLNLPPDVVRVLVVSPRYRLFDRLTGELGIDPVFAGVAVVRVWKALLREGLPVGGLSDEEVFAVFKAYRDGRFAKEGLAEVLRETARRKNAATAGAGIDEVLDVLGYTPADEDTVRVLAGESIRQTDIQALYNPGSVHRYLMGHLMEQLRGRTDGSVVAAVLEEELRKHKEPVHG
jgi:glutamyl-tRNA(Gln) amidotransferase subunit E